MRRGLLRGIISGVALSLPIWALVACGVAKVGGNHPAPSYVICNETGNDAGCGDPVNVAVMDSDNGE